MAVRDKLCVSWTVILCRVVVVEGRGNEELMRDFLHTLRVPRSTVVFYFYTFTFLRGSCPSHQPNRFIYILLYGYYHNHHKRLSLLNHICIQLEKNNL